MRSVLYLPVPLSFFSLQTILLEKNQIKQGKTIPKKELASSFTFPASLSVSLIPLAFLLYKNYFPQATPNPSDALFILSIYAISLLPIAISFQLVSFKSKPHKPAMSSFEFDKVKAEKADAMRRYNRKRNFYYFLEAVGALVLLWCSFSCFPVITQTTSRYLSFFNQKIYVFVLANMFILIVYISSTTAHNNDRNVTPLQADIYDEYVSFSTSSSSRWKTTTHDDKQLVVSSLQEKPVQVKKEKNRPVREKDTFDNDKQIVCCEKNVDAANVEVEEKPVRDLTLLKEEKLFRRTRSARCGKERRDYLREFRRSETEIGRETLSVIRTGTCLNYVTPAAAKKSILEMNNDEFKITVERFIATTKKILREESIEDFERGEYCFVK